MEPRPQDVEPQPRQRVGLKEIAEMAGVSVATVSMALSSHPRINEQTKQRIREISQQAGYRRVSRAGRPRNRTASEQQPFGFALIGGMLQDELHMSVLRGITDAAARAQTRVEVLAIEHTGRAGEVIGQLTDFARGVSGVLLTGFIDGDMLAQFEIANVPHVVIGHPMRRMLPDNERLGQVVTSDETAMGELAVQTLLDRGHRRIAFICERLPRGMWNDRWLRGYRAAMAEAELPPAPELIHVVGRAFAGGAPAARDLMRLDSPPTAFIVPDARSAANFIEAMRAQGTEPDPQAMVISGQPDLLEPYGLGDYPWIGMNFTLLARVAVHQLQQICQRRLPCATELLIPFQMRNIPSA